MAIQITHRNVMNEFEKLYGEPYLQSNSDVFGTLRNEEYLNLKKVIATKKASEEYTRSS